jgi:hypothetical protein
VSFANCRRVGGAATHEFASGLTDARGTGGFGQEIDTREARCDTKKGARPLAQSLSLAELDMECSFLTSPTQLPRGPFSNAAPLSAGLEEPARSSD